MAARQLLTSITSSNDSCKNEEPTYNNLSVIMIVNLSYPGLYNNKIWAHPWKQKASYLPHVDSVVVLHAQISVLFLAKEYYINLYNKVKCLSAAGIMKKRHFL